MERYLRFYLKFQAYIIAIGTIAGSLLTAFVTLYAVSNSFDMPLEQFYDFRFMGHVGLLFSAVWFGIGISFFYGVYTETKKFIYPFVVFFMLDLFLLVVRDIVLIWQNKRYYNMVFLNPICIVIALFITLHVMLTVVAMGRLFHHDPLAQPGTNFVRFKTDSAAEGNSSPQAGHEFGDEESLVED